MADDRSLFYGYPGWQPDQFQQFTKPPQRPHIMVAEDAYLTDTGVMLEVADHLRVFVPSRLLRRLETLLTMAALAQLVPPDTPSPSTP